MLVSELRDEYFATNLFVRSPDTRRLISLSVKHFERFLARAAEVGDLTDRQLGAYMAHRRELGRAESTIEREASKLFSLWRFAAASGLIRPPRMRLAKARLELPVAFLRPEVRRLFKAAKRYPVPIDGVAGHVYMLALLDLIWDTAERVGALRDLDRSDIDLKGRWVRIGTRKGHGRTLVRRIRRQTAKSLTTLLASHSGPKAFGSLNRSSLYGHLNRILVAAGLPVDRHHKFHCLRRSHASYLHKAGGDATDSLGHSSEDMNRKYYYDVRITAGRQPISYLFSPLGLWGRLLSFVGL